MGRDDDRDDDDDRSPKRGRSPERSPERERERSPSPIETDSMTISDQDAAFVLGKGGSTKNKLARVSGARLELHERDLRLDITGTRAARKRASEYIGFVLAQRVGPVTIDFEEVREDLSVVTVPEDCVGYVMGRGGQALRGMEEEWGTLMFFAKVRSGPQGGSEKLAIFGTRRARRGAELKVMSAVEHKHPGHFLSSGGTLRDPLKQPGDGEGDGWDYDLVPLTNEEFSYALGGGGSTRKKLARAADCIMEYVGLVAVIAGFEDERKRANDYITWLLQQRKGPVSVPDLRGRDDLTVVEVPRDSVGFITGHKGESLREIERVSGTFCFADGEKGSNNKGGVENLLIFGASADGRRMARRIVEDKIADSQYRDSNRGGGGGRDRDRYDDRDRGRYDDRDRNRGRYDDRDRDRDRGRDDRDDRRRDDDRDRRRSRSRSRGRY